jgi:hypothetical protein
MIACRPSQGVDVASSKALLPGTTVQANTAPILNPVIN